MINLKNVVLRRGAKVILDSASVNLNPGEKVGLVGRNGAGKSSLFAMLNGTLHEDGGEFYIPEQWRMSQVAQDMPETEQSATSYVIEGDVVLQAAQAEVDAADAAHVAQKLLILATQFGLLRAQQLDLVLQIEEVAAKLFTVLAQLLSRSLLGRLHGVHALAQLQNSPACFTIFEDGGLAGRGKKPCQQGCQQGFDRLNDQWRLHQRYDSSARRFLAWTSSVPPWAAGFSLPKLTAST